jgi:hypothetical protein
VAILEEVNITFPIRDDDELGRVERLLKEDPDVRTALVK